jgi:DNA polymerase-3 subunit delta
MEHKLYHGNSAYLSLERVHNHIKEIQTKESSIEVLFYDADSTDPEKIVDILASQNLFAPKRILIFKRFSKNKKKDNILTNLEEIFKNNNSQDIALFWEDQKVKANTKYFKIFKKNTEELTELNKRSFLPWLRERLKEAGLKIQPEALKTLATRTNFNPERCLNEIDKFLLNENLDTVTLEDVNALITDTLEETIWALIDAINQGNSGRSLEILENLNKQGTDPNYTISMLARNIRMVTLTKYLIENNHSYKDIASLLKTPPFLVPSLVSTSKNYKEEKLKTIYSKLSNLDFQIKTGQIDGNLGLTLICPYL